ncbi:type II secretion system secretin GspD [Thalassococcus lentus]|uniref:Type II secretion system secretin GspD n=1 Tax=Thalassococcus lentus TaxID=1210524 RepID=A0ABT4XUT9_9RHOB|nr:type II secretion system secretin GspD [Thalassococcus lentus]MDA7425615.1 type II secretion system secretin GspD [Thalassococcus lentus]
MQFLRLALSASAFFLFGCTETITTSSGLFGEDIEVQRGANSDFSLGAGHLGGTHMRAGALSHGSDTFLNEDVLRNSGKQQAVVVPRDGKLVEISLINASIPSAAKAILGDTLKQQYTVSDAVTGTVTIQSTGLIPKTALLELFEAALSANDARLERHGNVVKIVPGTSGNRTFRLAKHGVGSGANIIVAPLEYVSATQMLDLMSPLTDEGLTVLADKRRNLLMMTGTPAQLEAALDALNLFDVDVLSGKSIALVELNSADPESIVEELKVIFENEEGGNLNGVIEFVPNKRLGSVLIISSRSKYLPKAQRWIRELDRTASGASRYMRSYELQNRNAEDVTPILEKLLATSGQEGNEEAETSHLNSLSLASDTTRNAILARATRSEHREIVALLTQIDQSPSQVMLEATIAEVTLNDELDLGVRWFFEEGKLGLTFSDASNGSTGSSYPGFSAVFSAGGANVALNALAGVTDVKIISSPTLMVLDNEEAILQIGDQVPIATQTLTDNSSDDAPTVTTIDYRDTGVILRVKPDISRTGRVVLDVTQEVSNVTEAQTSGIDSPTIRQRKIATNVLLNDGATLALGGLVQESDTRTVAKVPGLGDVPLLGAAFRKTNSGKKRSELLILIRPSIINSDTDAAAVTKHWRTKLSGADSLLESGLGSPRHTIGSVLQ